MVMGAIPTMNHYLPPESNLQPHALKLMLSTVRPAPTPSVINGAVDTLRGSSYQDLTIASQMMQIDELLSWDGDFTKRSMTTTLKFPFRHPYMEQMVLQLEEKSIPEED